MRVPRPESLESQLVLAVVASAAVLQHHPRIVQVDSRILTDRHVGQMIPQLGLLNRGLELDAAAVSRRALPADSQGRLGQRYRTVDYSIDAEGALVKHGELLLAQLQRAVCHGSIFVPDREVELRKGLVSKLGLDRY